MPKVQKRLVEQTEEARLKRNAQARERRKLNPEKFREAGRRSYYNHHEKNLAAAKRANWNRYWSDPKKEMKRTWAWHQANPGKSREMRLRSYHKNAENQIPKRRSYYQENRPAFLIRGREKRRTLKIEVLGKYGELICKCCLKTEIESLTLDHINGGGAAHRKTMGYKGVGMYSWLKKNSYPPGFQILCMECNWMKGKYGQCPHELMLTPIDTFFIASPP